MWGRGGMVWGRGSMDDVHICHDMQWTVFVCRGESDRPHLLHSPTNAMCGVHWNQCTTPGSSQEGVK